MILSINDFCQSVQYDLNGLIEEVTSDVVGRPTTDNEKRAMASSYPAVAKVLNKAKQKNPLLGEAHISTNEVLLEYRLPAAPAWCDLVLLGEGFGNKQAVIIELKDWVKNDSDQPGDYEGYIMHKGVKHHHPSDQVKGYVEYCQNFHSSVVDNNAKVKGCVFFTRDIDTAPYCRKPNHHLSESYPMFNTETLDGLATFICDSIEAPNETWATSFVNGHYKQNRNILLQVSEALKKQSSQIRPFVLLDGQRTGFAEVMSILNKVVKKQQKEVIIVKGPPGSGKSAVAVNLWVEAVQQFNKEREPGNIVFVSTSSSQKDNWAQIFLKSNRGGADGFILPANAYNPGMNGGKMKDIYVPIFESIDAEKYLSSPVSLKYEYYEDYTNYMIEHGLSSNYHENHHFLSIVDEAHALINPVADGFCTNKTAGWCMQMGPQAYHIIRQSQVSVFFMDGKQSFRDNETTTVNDIISLAEKQGAHVSVVSLSGMQFRCAGSVDYVDWVENIFKDSPLKNHKRWEKHFHFEVVDNTTEMEDFLLQKKSENQVVRLLSSYSVDWASRNFLDEQHTGEPPYDFDFVNENGIRFQRHWNNPKGYEIFVQASRGTMMSVDPLCEVGCPYVVRGFDFDYVGILWLDDLLWRNGTWYINFPCAKETANSSSRKSAREELVEKLVASGMKKRQAKEVSIAPIYTPYTPNINAFANNIIQSYRILMTRAVKGVILYVRDKETREHIRELLK